MQENWYILTKNLTQEQITQLLEENSKTCISELLLEDDPEDCFGSLFGDIDFWWLEDVIKAGKEFTTFEEVQLQLGRAV